VICTSSNKSMLAEIDLLDSFDASLRVPAITSLTALAHLLSEVDLFRRGSDDQRRLMDILGQAGMGQGGRMAVGVKKILSMVEMARQDEDPVGTFANNLIDYAS
jgi:vesicle-fusing ATPase